MPRPNPGIAGCKSVPVRHLVAAEVTLPVASRVQACLGWWQLLPAQCNISLYLRLVLSPGLAQGTVPPKVLPPCVTPCVAPPRLRGTHCATCNGQWERPCWAAPTMQGVRCDVQGATRSGDVPDGLPPSCNVQHAMCNRDVLDGLPPPCNVQRARCNVKHARYTVQWGHP